MPGLVPGIHVFARVNKKGVDGRDKPGHDEQEDNVVPGVFRLALRGTSLFLRILDRLEEILIASLMGAATIITFVAVVHRFLVDVPVLYPYLFGINLAWSQELCIYMFIWMAKFGAAYGVRTGIHVGVDVLINQLNDRWRKVVILFGLAGGALFTAIVGTMGAKFVIELMHTDQVSPDLELPSWLVYACIPLGSYLMCFRFLQVMWVYFRTDELPHHDAAHVDDIEVSSTAPISLGEA